jgi:uncharacterized protein
MSPLYAQLTTEGWQYVYDSITNRIIRVGPEIYDALPYCLDSMPFGQASLGQQGTARDIDVARRSINALRVRYGAFSVQALKERGTALSEEGVRDIFADKGVSGCSLELTEQCNFRCKYCTYSGGYTNQRTHGRRNMSWSVAKLAVDLYLEMNRDVGLDGQLAIGFYGGEPFLRFPLVQKVMEFTKEHQRLLPRHDERKPPER